MNYEPLVKQAVFFIISYYSKVAFNPYKLSGKFQKLAEYCSINFKVA